MIVARMIQGHSYILLKVPKDLHFSLFELIYIYIHIYISELCKSILEIISFSHKYFSVSFLKAKTLIYIMYI